jgi:hypothetical protein
MFPVVLNGHETYLLTLIGERRLRGFEKRVLRRIFGSKRDEVTREWRKLHNVELTVLYSSPNVIQMVKLRRMRWTGHVALVWERRRVYRVWVGKPEGMKCWETQS